MSRFVLEEIEIPHGRIKIFRLVNPDDPNDCEYDKWRQSIEQAGTFSEELDKLDTILIDHSQMRVRLPDTKFKELSGRKKNDTVKDFECRTKNLRLYLFKIDEGKVVVLGGSANKTQQPQDIGRMRSIKKSFLS